MSIALSDWMLKTLREEANQFALTSGWLEMERFEWVPLVSRTISHILHGGTLLLCTDENLEWFGKYVMSNINKMGAERPLVPVFGLKEIMPDIAHHDNVLVHDMLAMSYKDYSFWYVGKMGTRMAEIALNKQNGFFWIFDDAMQGALKLDSADKMMDYKLIQLYKNFEKALFGAILGDINLE